MEKKETIKFMQRIKSHYQEFVIDDFKINEWYKELIKYDDEDVNSKFDEHLRSEVYGEQIPKLHFLTKYLIPASEKGKIHHHTIVCQLCGQAILDSMYDKHYSRCSSASTIVRDLRKYFNLKVDYQQLMNLTDEKFEELYLKYLNKMLEAPLPDFRKAIILRILYPDTQIDVNGIVKEMAENIL